MRRLLLLVVLIASPLLADDFRNATPAELAMKDIAIAPGAPAVVLDWIQRTDDINLRSTEYVRMKILTDEGKKYGDVSIPYLPEYFSFERFKARMTKPDGTIVPFNGTVYDKLIVKVGGRRYVSKTFTMPDVQAGCIIEYSYELGFRHNYFFDSRFNLQKDIPVLHELVVVRPYTKGNFTTFFMYRGLPAGKAPRKVSDHFDLELDNMPAFETEPFAPPEDELKALVLFYYAEGKVDNEKFWKTTAAIESEHAEKFMGAGSGVRSATNAAIAGAKSEDEKVRKLYARAQQIRNVSYEHEKTDPEQKTIRENKNADDVLANGYGTREDINRLFVAMTRAAGFDAYVVRLGDRSERFLSKRIPIASQLNNEVALVAIDKKMKLLDPATPFAPFGVLSWEKTRVSGLRLASRDAGAWVDIPEDTPDVAKIRRKATVRLEGDTLKAKVVVTLDGQEGLGRKLERYNDDEAAAKKSFETAAKEWFADGSTVTLTKLSGLRSAGEPLVEEYDVTIPATAVGSRALVPLAIFNVARKPPFPAATRKNDIDFGYEYQVHDDITLELPDGYAVESAPGSSDIDIGAMLFKARYERGDKSVSLSRDLTVATTQVMQTRYAIVREFFSRMATADQDQVVLRKTN